MPTASAAAALAASSSPDVTVDTADGATAAAASARAADVAVDPALGAATTADTADQGRKRDCASISGPSDGDVAGGRTAMADDATVDESAVTADDGAGKNAKSTIHRGLPTAAACAGTRDP